MGVHMNSTKPRLTRIVVGPMNLAHLISRRRGRGLLVAIVVFVAAVIGRGEQVDAEPCWAPPVEGVITDGFREPACPWCAGNRGIEYEVASSTVVRAASTGRVSFSGVVAGTLYVVVEVARGWRLTYGKLDTTHLATGDVVIAGSAIGRVSDEFYFGLRDGDVHLDPAPYLGRLVGRPRLIPFDGSAARPSTSTHLRCQPRSGAR